MECIIRKLCDKNVVKTCDIPFILKSGETSTLYIDLREIISYPNLFNLICEHIHDSITSNNVTFDHICGVPYGGIPYTVSVSQKLNKPFLILRKETKQHGTGKIIEGKYFERQKILLIEDVITSGASILESIQKIESQGLIVSCVLCIVDRESGGIEKLKQRGYENIISLIKLSQIKQILSFNYN
jgi:uridine monophosphate synthetase